MIALGSDHAGFALKETLKAYLKEKGFETYDYGTYDENRCDYPVYSYRVAKAVAEGKADKGILVCGTGVGSSIAANKVNGIRCVCCSDPYSAELSRRHNDSNVLALGSRVIGEELAKMIVDMWLNAEFEGGRHAGRIAMFKDIENGFEPGTEE